jgi:hypothetical protein
LDIYRKIRLQHVLVSALPGLAEAYENLQLARYARRLRSEGWALPAHPLIKRALIRRELLRFKADSLVETGTYLGDTVWFLRRAVPRLYTIELEPRLAALARRRFRHWAHIEVLEGDSGEVLEQLAPTLSGRVVFWLDGHYSSGITGRGAVDSPIWAELTAITRSCRANYSIMIDDARLFGSDPAYPTLAEIRRFLEDRISKCQLRVENDIVYCHGGT